MIAEACKSREEEEEEKLNKTIEGENKTRQKGSHFEAKEEANEAGQEPGRRREIKRPSGEGKKAIDE